MPPLSLGNVIAYVIQVSLIAAATGACMTLVRLRNPEARYWSWRALLWLAVVLPLVQPWQALTVIVAPAAIANAATELGVRSTLAPQPAAVQLNPVLIVIAGGMVIRLLWLAVGAIRLRRI
ncbi:MAG: hypothetical protein H0W53_21145, partial [Acidobacteria bacterium]|nr:hypothetical protein [Acidobacteriota bacterium]